MSIYNIPTSFNNVSVGPYVIDNFTVNSNGFSNTLANGTLALPGVYGQGTTILSVDLCAPTTNLNSILNGNNFTLWAYNNLGASGTRTLYQAIGTLAHATGVDMGKTLPADSWLVLGAQVSMGSSNVPIGAVVKYLTLTQTQGQSW